MRTHENETETENEAKKKNYTQEQTVDHQVNRTVPSRQHLHFSDTRHKMLDTHQRFHRMMSRNNSFSPSNEGRQTLRED